MPLTPAHVTLDDDQAALIEAVREFSRGELLPRDRQWDEEDTTLGDFLPQLAEMGLMSLLAPESLGGLGCRYSTYAAILHELSICSPAACVALGVHNMAGTILDRFAAEPLRSDVLSTWGKPESFAAFALSEAGAGSDAAAVSTAATKVDGGYKINGEKMWISNALTGRWMLTLARLQDAPKDQSLCAFLVDGNEPGLERTPIHGKMGIKGDELAVLNYADVFVPDGHLLGTPGRGLEVFLSTLNRGRTGIAAQATGLAEACLTEMVSYARQREQFGRPIGEFQAVGNMIADSAVELEAARVLAWRAATGIDSGKTDRRICAMAKLYASEAANRIAYRAVQVHGGSGYVRECRVEQLYRDARVMTIYEGTSEVQRIVIARQLKND